MPMYDQQLIGGVAKVKVITSARKLIVGVAATALVGVGIAVGGIAGYAAHKSNGRLFFFSHKHPHW